jgi:hypothetical protein
MPGFSAVVEIDRWKVAAAAARPEFLRALLDFG